MDKKQLKQVTTKVYEEYGFVKVGKYYYLDLDDIIICSGFASVYDITFLMYNFSIKAIHNDEERKLNNMFDGYDSCENDIEFNKYKKGIFRREIRYEEWTEEYYTKKLKKLLRYYFDPFKKNALAHIRKSSQKPGYVNKGDLVLLSISAKEYLGIKKH